MKQLNKSLCDFIATFELDHPTKGICFEAVVYFIAEKLKIKTKSEIQIVTINGKGMDVLYILNKTIEIEEIPGMFVIRDFEVSFNRQHGFKLKGVSSRWGLYTVIIQPRGRHCKEPTYQEINAKTYN